MMSFRTKTLDPCILVAGTPSILKVDELKSIIDEVLKYFSFNEDIEINPRMPIPDDLEPCFFGKCIGAY